MPRRYALVLGLGIACGGGPSNTVTVGVPHVDASGGDYVVYRFSGSLLQAPVTLREIVKARDGGRVTLEVTAKRGDAERRWIQVEPDSADARWNNTVDELYVVRDGVKERLPNPDNATLARLYEWVLASADAEASGRESVACEQRIGTEKTTCMCERATVTVGGKTVRTEESRCPGFSWQRGPARWTTEDGKVVWQVDVVEGSLKRD